ncbi:MAG TPA: cyclase family protein [Thermoplasmata archaeon]|nr:cyclase family protein [Thermoplasmata archaeon]
MPIEPGMPSFPGDPPVEIASVRSIARGDPYNLSSLRLGSHTGTHVDPPLHFLTRSASVDRLDLDLLSGPALLIDVPADRTRIGREELRAVPAGTTRLLLRTANSSRGANVGRFDTEYVSLTLDGARRLLELEVRFVGIDALSIESDPSERFPVHRKLLGHSVPILEGILLAEAAPGSYRLDCLPLRLKDGDGGPARAVLRPA